MELAEDLIRKRRSENLTVRPVVLNLSSWTKGNNDFVEWLKKELLQKYHIQERLGDNWISKQWLAILLDGLDEVKEEYRSACVDALNNFMSNSRYSKTHVAICCRIDEYEQLNERLKIRTAIYIRSFSTKQVGEYLDEYHEDVKALQKLLKENDDLMEFAKTPINLYMMSQTYQQWNEEQLGKELLVNPQQRKHNLFNCYINARLTKNKEETKDYPSDDQVRHWLTWLAEHMSQSVFQIEDIQPEWLSAIDKKNTKDIKRYKIIIGLFVGILVGLTSGIYFVYFSTITSNAKLVPPVDIQVKLIAIAALSGTIPGLIAGRVSSSPNRALKWLILGTIFAISVSLFVYLIVSPLSYQSIIPPALLSGVLGGAILSSIDSQIQPVRKLEPDWMKLFKFAGIFGLLGIIYAFTRFSLRHIKAN